MQDQHNFYILSELFISMIGALVLLAIWSAIRTYFKPKLSYEINIKRVDKGLLFFSLAVFIWSFSSIVTYAVLPIHIDKWWVLMSQNTFSILNSMFLIFGLFYLDNAPSYLYNNKKSTIKIVSGLVLLSILSFVLAIYFGHETNVYGLRYSLIPDLILSGILGWFLMISLYRTFVNRAMFYIAILAVFIVLLLIVSQFSVVFFNDGSYKFYFDLMKIISKTGLIAIFLVLGTSWVIELAQTPTVTDMNIHFTDWNQIVLSIPSKGIINQKLEFGKKTTQFNNLLKFAIRRKYAPEQDMCIEIIGGGEIPSQTYLSRIIDNLNEIVSTEDLNKLTRNDFFTFIGQGKYRLRFLPTHIEIDSALLNEFVHNTNHKIYKDFL